MPVNSLKTALFGLTAVSLISAQAAWAATPPAPPAVIPTVAKRPT